MKKECKCGGTCKVCKCKLEKYKIKGEMWDMISDKTKEEVIINLENFMKVTDKDLKDKSFIFETARNLGMGLMVPYLMLKVEGEDLMINSGITLERLHDEQIGKK